MRLPSGEVRAVDAESVPEFVGHGKIEKLIKANIPLRQQLDLPAPPEPSLLREQEFDRLSRVWRPPTMLSRTASGAFLPEPLTKVLSPDLIRVAYTRRSEVMWWFRNPA